MCVFSSRVLVALYHGSSALPKWVILRMCYGRVLGYTYFQSERIHCYTLKRFIMIEQSSFTKLVGSALGFYTLEQLLDQSILGATFMARSSTASATYRVRVLRLSSTMTPEARIVFFGHFQQQARELAELLTDRQAPKQPNLLPLLDYGNAQSLPYLVSPYTPAPSLTMLVSTKGAMDAQTVSRYLDTIATALEYVHQHGILHRDLTTDLIFVPDKGPLVIADLGVMRILETSRKEAQQALLYGNGPSAAPAPEQLLGQPVQTYTDVYAMGALLYRLLTGHRVFGASSRDKMVEMHLHSPVPSVGQWRQVSVDGRDITAELDKLLAAALAKDPKQRIQHPAELANQYAQLIGFYPGRQPVGIVGAPIAPVSAVARPAASLPMTAPAVPPPSSTPKAASHAPVPTRPARSARSAQMPDQRRRTLLLAGAGAIVVVAGVGFIAEHLLTNHGTVATGGTQGATDVIARASAVPVNSAITFKAPNSSSANPDILVHLQNGQFVAFNSTCTHAGCAVSYNSQDHLLECPCHGATFDPAKGGAVVHGPAKTPLASVPITVNSDGTITLGGAAQAAPTSQPTQKPKPAGNVIAQAAAVPVNSAKTFKLPGSNSANPDILVHLKNGQFVAFDSTCTHAGCAVSYNSQDQLLECPCHGAAFDPAKQGAVVQGPATTPLAAIKITVNSDGTITAD
jgi:Rieske Fe-S protein